MAISFFAVGLEIKRECLVGELAERRNAMLPIAAAIGGMLVPALGYAAVNDGGPGARGWGIPMATLDGRILRPRATIAWPHLGATHGCDTT